jgi:hypothetical protein
MSSRVATSAGVAESSGPPTTSVSTSVSRSVSYSSSSGAGGKAPASSPPVQMNVPPGSPRIGSWACGSEKCARAKFVSARATAANSPHTWARGKNRFAASDWNQNPLASPSAAASQESSVMGDDRGAASSPESSSPQKVATRTLPRLILSGPQRPGMSSFSRSISRARSSVRLSHKDRANIHKTIDEKILGGDRLPSARPRSSPVAAGSRSELELAGTRRPASFELNAGADGRVRGTLPVPRRVGYQALPGDDGRAQGSRHPRSRPRRPATVR